MQEPFDTDDVDVRIGSTGRPVAGEAFELILERRLSRRTLLGGAAAGFALVAAPTALRPGRAAGASAAATSRAGAGTAFATMPGDGSTLAFAPIAGTNADEIVVPTNYTHEIVIRWGDSLVEGVPDLDTTTLAGDALRQPPAPANARKQFGYNCDAVEFFPLPEGGHGVRHGIICVNHEYTNDELLFPTYDPDAPGFDVEDFVSGPDGARAVAYMKAVHGVSVLRVWRRDDGTWKVIKQGPSESRTRRIHGDTLMAIAGPARRNRLLKTDLDPTGTKAYGTLNNCAAGKSPYGTYLTSEENFDQYFGNADALAARVAELEALGKTNAKEYILKKAAVDAHGRIPLPGGKSNRGWEFVDERFDVAKHPNEAFRFGWIVEIDPYDPNWRPRKRTALGRFKHECATSIKAADGRLVVYSGDDARMEYMYKFVSAAKVTGNRVVDRDQLLNRGTLYVAKFADDGTGEWLPVVHGSGPLTAANGFPNQQQVLIETRRAADLLGATPMDRPEDFQANPATGKVYCALTNNSRRTFPVPPERDFQGRPVSTEASPPNPRADSDGGNRWGHIMEISEDGDDNGATTFTWEILLLCGDPDVGNFLTDIADVGDIPLARDDTYFGGFADASQLSPIGSPDNVGFDNEGNLWIVTDGTQPRGHNNGAFVTPVSGADRGRLQQFLSGPLEAEVCGCIFNPDDTTFFVAIQHPGERGTLSSLTSNWPDGGGNVPRPSLVAVRHVNGSPIGSA